MIFSSVKVLMISPNVKNPNRGAFIVSERISNSSLALSSKIYCLAMQEKLKIKSQFLISLFIFLITVAGAIFQWPIGYFSDRTDRRIIIIACTFIGAFFVF